MESDTVYEFEGVSKIIIDNINENYSKILSLLQKKYKTIEHEKLKEDFDNFLFELNKLGIKRENIKNIIISKNIEKLTNASIEIINNCPFKCQHCYISKKANKIDYETYKNIIDELVDLNCKELLITGGEPMLHEKFLQMYLYAKEKGLLVSINTNAYLLTSSILNVLNEYKPKIVEISIYGTNNSNYKNFTSVDNAYSKVNNNILKLLKKKININLKTVLTKSNKEYIYDIKEYSEKLKLPFRFDYVIFPNKDDNYSNNERCSPNEIIDVLKKDDEVSMFFKQKIKNLNVNNKEINNYIFQCSIGSSRIFIDSNLNLRPCLVVPFQCKYPKYKIKDAYYKFMNISKKYKYTNSKCKDCYKKSICRYCPGKFYMETGDFEKVPRFYCEVAEKIIKEFS